MNTSKGRISVTLFSTCSFNLEVPLRSPLVISFAWGARAPSIKFYSRIRTNTNMSQGAQKFAMLLALTTFRQATILARFGFLFLNFVAAIFELFLSELFHLLQDWNWTLGRNIELQLSFKIMQLFHEVKIRGNIRLSRTNYIESVIEVERALIHQVSNSNGD